MVENNIGFRVKVEVEAFMLPGRTLTEKEYKDLSRLQSSLPRLNSEMERELQKRIQDSYNRNQVFTYSNSQASEERAQDIFREMRKRAAEQAAKDGTFTNSTEETMSAWAKWSSGDFS